MNSKSVNEILENLKNQWSNIENSFEDRELIMFEFVRRSDAYIATYEEYEHLPDEAKAFEYKDPINKGVEPANNILAKYVDFYPSVGKMRKISIDEGTVGDAFRYFKPSVVPRFKGSDVLEKYRLLYMLDPKCSLLELRKINPDMPECVFYDYRSNISNDNSVFYADTICDLELSPYQLAYVFDSRKPINEQIKLAKKYALELVKSIKEESPNSYVRFTSPSHDLSKLLRVYDFVKLVGSVKDAEKILVNKDTSAPFYDALKLDRNDHSISLFYKEALSYMDTGLNGKFSKLRFVK